MPDCVRSGKKELSSCGIAFDAPVPACVRAAVFVSDGGKGAVGNAELAGCYNVGPDDCDCVNTGRLADLFCETWGGGMH
ncbi:MAG: hypothetical protein ACLR3S_13210 [Clostridium fessum]